MQIKPVPIQNTLLLINQFVVQTTMFLNSFANAVETKICKVRYGMHLLDDDLTAIYSLQYMTCKMSYPFVSLFPFPLLLFW